MNLRSKMEIVIVAILVVGSLVCGYLHLYHRTLWTDVNLGATNAKNDINIRAHQRSLDALWEDHEKMKAIIKGYMRGGKNTP